MASSNQECGTRFFFIGSALTRLGFGEVSRLRLSQAPGKAFRVSGSGKNVPVPAARDQAPYCPNVIFQLEIIPASFNF